MNCFSFSRVGVYLLLEIFFYIRKVLSLSAFFMLIGFPKKVVNILKSIM
jgi:hypothetical protein